ncbi:MAG TPA: TIM barrel protein [Pyrinomonadaceae bacterium]|nr:TIM barrel protein [Pyrinomonadaceae bacterium]
MIDVDINISVLLKEYPFLERFDRAKRLGFSAVEFYWNREEDPNHVAERVQDAGLRVAAFNFDAGDMAAGDRGLLSDPNREAELRENVPIAIELADRLRCGKLTALTGNLNPELEREPQLDLIRENLRWICELAGEAGITVLVEAINAYDNKLYPFTTTRETVAFLNSVEVSNLKYLYDIYHMQRMEGNLAETLMRNIESIGHIQIADSPARHQPGTGEINYRYIFQEIENSGYGGYVGLEYNPSTSTEESLDWLPIECRGRIEIERLNL